jgi:hypothetical protein
MFPWLILRFAIPSESGNQTLATLCITSCAKATKVRKEPFLLNAADLAKGRNNVKSGHLHLQERAISEHA